MPSDGIQPTSHFSVDTACGVRSAPDFVASKPAQPRMIKPAPAAIAPAPLVICPCKDKYRDRKSTRLNQSLMRLSNAVFCLKKKKKIKKKHKTDYINFTSVL